MDFGSYSRLSRTEYFEIWGIYVRFMFYPGRIACAFIPADFNLNSFLHFEIEQAPSSKHKYSHLMREAVTVHKLPTLLQTWRDGNGCNQLSAVLMLPGISTIRCGHGTEGQKSPDSRLGTVKKLFCCSDQGKGQLLRASQEIAQEPSISWERNPRENIYMWSNTEENYMVTLEASGRADLEE